MLGNNEKGFWRAFLKTLIQTESAFNFKKYLRKPGIWEIGTLFSQNSKLLCLPEIEIPPTRCIVFG
jgi:hypothetical protein